MAEFAHLYDSIHSFSLSSPCFSFDILRDDLGFSRSAFPHTVFGVAGTSAMEETSSNYIGIFKLSNISGKSKTTDLEAAATTNMDSNSVEAPILQLRKVFHDGNVNQIRAMSQNPHICASWANTGYVQVWDLSSHLNALAESTDTISNNAIAASNEAPLVKFKHEDEGYALDWSPLVPGKLVSGDYKNFIHLWEPTDATWNIDDNPFVGHTASVEYLQWSPSMPSVFASCSGDGSIATWDTRIGKSPTTTIKAHEADVNVISWHGLHSDVMASGSDDGSFAIWDFRMLMEYNHVERFKYHKDRITFIEWSPHKDTLLAVSSYDDELTIWNLGYGDPCVEHVLKDTTEEQVDVDADAHAFSCFPELAFIYRGQQDVLELHWHPQIPGMLISTSLYGFKAMIPTTIAEYLIPESDHTSNIVEKLEDCHLD